MKEFVKFDRQGRGPEQVLNHFDILEHFEKTKRTSSELENFSVKFSEFRIFS